MLTQYTLKMPHAVYSGKDALDKLTQIIGTGVKKTAVFTDRGIIGAGLLELPLSTRSAPVPINFTGIPMYSSIKRI